MYDACPSVPSGFRTGCDRVRGSDLQIGAPLKVADAQPCRIEVCVG